MLTYLNKIIGITKAAFPVVGMNMVKLTTELTEENQNLCNDLDRMIAQVFITKLVIYSTISILGELLQHNQQFRDWLFREIGDVKNCFASVPLL